MAGIDIDKLADELAAGLLEYSDNVTEVIKNAVNTVSKNAAEELKNTSPVRSRAYAKNWTSKTVFEDKKSKRNTVYNKKHYQLTHLLEFGHAKRNGGRVKEIPHIKTVEEKAIRDFEEAIKKGV